MNEHKRLKDNLDRLITIKNAKLIKCGISKRSYVEIILTFNGVSYTVILLEGHDIRKLGFYINPDNFDHYDYGTKCGTRKFIETLEISYNVSRCSITSYLIEKSGADNLWNDYISEIEEGKQIKPIYQMDLEEINDVIRDKGYKVENHNGGFALYRQKPGMSFHRYVGQMNSLGALREMTRDIYDERLTTKK